MEHNISKSTPILRAVGYRRVSMKDQVDGHSLDAQENNIQRYATDHGWQLIQIYVDAGISAKKGSHRPAFEQLMQDAREKKFDVIVVDKIDRFYRHLNGLLTSLDQLNSYGVSFASVQEHLDFTSPWGKLMLTVLGMLAEIYLDNLRQETRKGKVERAHKGLWMGGIPYGYCNGLCSNCTDPNGKDYCPDFGQPNKSDGKVLVPHPIESQIVQQVFAWYQTGEWTHRSLATQLNQMTIPLADGIQLPIRQKGLVGKSEPGPFTRDVTRDMLNRLAYTGKVPYYGTIENGRYRHRKQPLEIYEGLQQPIISPETFYRAREICLLKTRIPYTSENPIQIFPLTGILYCAQCGGHMRGASKEHGKFRYYLDASQVDCTCQCPQKLVRAELIEEQILMWIKNVLAAVDNSELSQIHASQAIYENRFRRAQELYLAGEITREIYDQEKLRWENIAAPLRNFEIDTKIKFINKIAPLCERWDNLTQIKRKELLRLAIETALIHGNAFVSTQPTIAFLQVINTWPCHCGEGGI